MFPLDEGANRGEKTFEYIYIYIGSPVGNAGSQIHQAPTYIVGKVIVDFREVFVVG